MTDFAKPPMLSRLTRRDIMRGWLAASFGVGTSALLAPPAAGQRLPETPSCDGAGPTIAQTEGPYFTPRTPRKANFRRDAAGEAFTLIGFVLDRNCRPVPGALIDLWHADAQGAYDNAGFRLRGHQFADAGGRYAFETITPGIYTGRTRHFHAKAQRPQGRVLTTQLYFPGETGNRRDGIFDARLLMKVESASDGKIGRFDFVLGS